MKKTIIKASVQYSSDVGDFLVRALESEVHIDRYASIVLQNHGLCEEVRELRDILTDILETRNDR